MYYAKFSLSCLVAEGLTVIKKRTNLYAMSLDRMQTMQQSEGLFYFSYLFKCLMAVRIQRSSSTIAR